MISTAEISMYPFLENYKELIKAFIAKLSYYPDLQVMPGPTSTVVIGEYEQLMSCLTEMFCWSHEEHGKAVFVVKIMPGYEPS
ncbi:MAG: histidine kinase [Gimesia sp.]|nr:histidine kinase [Gimesia sp.]